jgi:Relaxase/Mobilisation nuclease domain
LSPNVYNVSYTHAAGSNGSASRGARYITRRPQLSREEREQGVEPTRESEWREIEHTGDKERFIEEANRRRDERRERAEEEGKDLSKDRSPGAAQYTHVVISPENGERMRDEDFHQVAREWTHDDSGREYPHVGAIHRDCDHHHMHLLIARDKFSKDELQERKERSEELVRDIERFRGLERDTGQDTGRQRETERDRGEGRGVRQQESREREPER